MCEISLKKYDFVFRKSSSSASSSSSSSSSSSQQLEQLNKVSVPSEEDSQWSLSATEEANSKNNLNNTSTKILAPVGGDALLPCRVGHLGDRQVGRQSSGKNHFMFSTVSSLYQFDSRKGH